MLSQPLERMSTARCDDKSHCVLIVDDDEAATDVLSTRLSRQGFETAIADSGQLGLTLARTERPSVILLDLRLPDMDGFELCQELVDDDETCEIPVIIVSGLERPDVLRRSRTAGCQYYLRKPYDPNALLALIQRSDRRIARAVAWGARRRGQSGYLSGVSTTVAFLITTGVVGRSWAPVSTAPIFFTTARLAASAVRPKAVY